MRLRPGSIAWFLKHELLLFWYNNAGAMTKGGTGRRLAKTSIVVWSLVWLVLHGLAFAFLYPVDASADGYPPRLLLPVAATMLAVFTFMLSSGLKASVEALFERRDLDLLLSSPLPSLTIFAVRLLGIVLGVGALYLLLFAPFAHVGLVLGKYRWLGLYPTILGTAAIAASLSMLLTLALVRLLGARRTRVVAQILGALAGASILIVSQAYSMVGKSQQEAAGNWLHRQLAHDAALGPDSPVWLPARAALGETGPLLSLLLFAAVAVVVTIRFTHRFFVHGLQQAASSTRAARRPVKPVRYRFRGSLFEVAVAKEWRVIVRDPQLISQILLQLLYLLPMCALIFSSTPGTALPALGAGLTLLSATLAGSLAWLTVLGEDAPDLLHASPASGRTLRLAKLAAAAMPPLLIVALPLLWLLATHPLAAVLVSFTLVGAVLTTVLIVQWRGRPTPRAHFNRRGLGDWTSNLIETINGLAWGGFSGLLMYISMATDNVGTVLLFAGLAIAAALTTLLVAWFTRRGG